MAKPTTYCRIAPTFWTDPDVRRRLSREQKHLLLYYFTSPHTNMAGLFYCPIAYAAAEAELPAADVEAWIAGPLAPFLTFDPDTDEVLVHRAAKHQIGDILMPRDNRAKGLRRVLADTHSKRLVARFFELYPDWATALGMDGAHRRPSAENEGASQAPPQAPSKPSTGTSTGTEAGTGTELQQPADGDLPESSPREPEQAPAADGGLSKVIHETLNEIGVLSKSEERQPFMLRAMRITSGLEFDCWKDPNGNTAPTEDRARLLKLAVYHWAAERAEGRDRELRSCLKFVIAQELDPFTIPASNRPSADSPAGKITATRSDDAGRASLERERDAAVEADQLRIQRWRNENPEAAARIEAEVEAEHPKTDPYSRVLAKAEVNRRITAEIEKRGAA